MAALGLSEHSLNMRGNFNFGGAPNDGPNRPGMLPPVPLLVSAATTAGAGGGDLHGVDGMFYNEDAVAYLRRYQHELNLLAAAGGEVDGRMLSGVFSCSDDQVGGQGDNQAVKRKRTSPHQDTLPPVKFNILDKMQLMANSGGGGRHQGINSHDKNGNLSQSDSCNTGRVKSPCNGLEIIPIIASTSEKKRRGPRKQKSPLAGPQLTITKQPNNINNNSSNSKRSATIQGLKHKIQNNAAKKEDSPLDFSTKRISNGIANSNDQGARQVVEADTSRLRDILSMKSGADEIHGAILNLSKSDSSPQIKVEAEPEVILNKWSNGSAKSESRSASRSSLMSSNHSDSMSPRTERISTSSNNQSFGSLQVEDDDDDDHDAGHQETPRTITPQRGVFGLPSPKLPTPGGLNAVSPNGGLPLNFGSFGSLFPGGMTPVLGQTPAQPLQMPTFDASSPMFSPHMSAMSPTLPFDAGVTPNGNGGGKIRTTRPFKAYPKDPMSFSAVGLYGLPLGTSPGSTEAYLHQQSNLAYAEFRKQMLNQSQINRTRRVQRNGVTSPDGFKEQGNSDDSRSGGEEAFKNACGKTEQQLKDEAYWERRRKNNEAAKRSRDARRAKEDEIAIRAAFLEQENLKLRVELYALKEDTTKLRRMLYSTT